MKFVDSGALTLLNRILGLAGAGGAQRTELEDGLVSQVLEIGPIVRSSRATPGTDGGIFVGIMQNEHTGPSNESSSINPYGADSFSFPPYPRFVPDGFDIWIIAATLFMPAGTPAEYTNGALLLQGDETQFGFGINEAGGVIPSGTVATRMVLANWDSVEAHGGVNIGVRGDGSTWEVIGIRMRRGQNLSYRSTSTGALISVCQVMIQLVPTALGQDHAT